MQFPVVRQQSVVIVAKLLKFGARIKLQQIVYAGFKTLILLFINVHYSSYKWRDLHFMFHRLRYFSSAGTFSEKKRLLHDQ